MIIYRITGRVAVFNNCGIVMMQPIVETSVKKIRKRWDELKKLNTSLKCGFKIRMDKLDVRLPTKEDIPNLFTVEEPSSLITKVVNIDTAEWLPECNTFVPAPPEPKPAKRSKGNE